MFPSVKRGAVPRRPLLLRSAAPDRYATKVAQCTLCVTTRRRGRMLARLFDSDGMPGNAARALPWPVSWSVLWTEGGKMYIQSMPSGTVHSISGGSPLRS
jgi:hypothetical protein